MRNIILGIVLLASVTGCTVDDHRGNCIKQVKTAYCKPTTLNTCSGTETIYDCTGVTNSAYSDAIKLCVETYK